MSIRSPFYPVNCHVGPRTVGSTFGRAGFVNPAFIDQHGGSRIITYAATAKVDERSCNNLPIGTYFRFLLLLKMTLSFLVLYFF